jgi:hypothetical protein
MRTTMTAAGVAAMLMTASVTFAADPICGDVNASSSVTGTDALLVLKKSVAQPITLNCSAYDNQFAACQTSLAGADTSLAACNSDLAACHGLPVCGNGLTEGSEECEAGDPEPVLNGETCESQAFAGGTLSCSAGCTFDTSGCYANRFDDSGATIKDRKTGLEWEKKTTDIDSGVNLSDPHDVDNVYLWSGAGTLPYGNAFLGFLATLNGASNGICFQDHCDWRLPTVAEMASITVHFCGSPPCVVDPLFLPTQVHDYWSSTTDQSNPPYAWGIGYNNGNTFSGLKTDANFVRAVRSGS